MIKLNNFPFPPSTNVLYKNSGRGRVKTHQYKEYEHECEAWEWDNIDLIRKAIKKVKGKLVTLELEVYAPKSTWYTKAGKPKKIDVTNRVKALEDCLFKMLDIDDCHVFKCTQEKCISDKGKYVDITIKEYE